MLSIVSNGVLEVVSRALSLGLRAIVLLVAAVLLALPTIAYLAVVHALLPKRDDTQARQAKWTPIQTAEPVASDHEDYYTRLARRFCPLLVLFPEDGAMGPPSEQGRPDLSPCCSADYQPRSVRLFLDQAHLRSWPMTWLPFLHPTASRRPTGADRIRDELERQRKTWMRSPRASLEIPGLHRHDFRYRVAHDLEGILRFVKVTRRLVGDAARCECQRAAWRKYFEAVTGGTPDCPETGTRDVVYPFEVYVRIVTADDVPAETERPPSRSLALQYWWFFFYNDFTNRHQADWEGITVILREEDSSEWPLPAGAAYFNHHDGRWRCWEHIERAGAEETHPVVYVARGSHASYFVPTKRGYQPDVTFFTHLDSLGIRVRHRVSAEEPDWVPNPRAGRTSKVYPEIKVIPRDLEAKVTSGRVDEETWNTWWWLFYGGTWGARAFLPFAGSSGVDGPRFQGDKWYNPWKWVRETCTAELPEDGDALIDLERPVL